MKTTKTNKETGLEEAVYSDELILDGVTAFKAMTIWMDIYFNNISNTLEICNGTAWRSI